MGSRRLVAIALDTFAPPPLMVKGHECPHRIFLHNQDHMQYALPSGMEAQSPKFTKAFQITYLQIYLLVKCGCWADRKSASSEMWIVDRNFQYLSQHFGNTNFRKCALKRGCFRPVEMKHLTSVSLQASTGQLERCDFGGERTSMENVPFHPQLI